MSSTIPKSTPESTMLSEPVAVRVWVDGRTIFLELVDGRIFGFPADRFRILNRASNAELQDADALYA